MSLPEDIADIKKEIVQSHNLIIKTDNLIKNLSTEIRQIQKKQQDYERKYWINSIWAYIIFAALAFAGVYIAFEAKISNVNRERDALDEQLKKAQAEADERQNKLSLRAQQEKAAERLLRLKRENRFLEALKVTDELDINRLTPVLARLVTTESEELRKNLAEEAFEKGKKLLKSGFLERALREFDRALSVKPPPGLLGEVYQQRGLLLLKLNRSSQAAKSLLNAVDAQPEASWADNTLFMAAGTLENAKKYEEAYAVYLRLVEDHPESRYVAQAHQRLQKLKKDVPNARPPRTQKSSGEPTKPEPKPDATPSATGQSQESPEQSH